MKNHAGKSTHPIRTRITMQELESWLFPATGLLRLGFAAATAMSFVLTAPAATFRYATSSNRIYVENGGTATLTDIKNALPNSPLQLVDVTNKIWLCRANLLVTDGSTLRLHGSANAGDVNELRLLSNNSTATN